jgi:hypothetical protein
MGLAPASKDWLSGRSGKAQRGSKVISASHERPFIGGHTFSCTLLLMVIGSRSRSVNSKIISKFAVYPTPSNTVELALWI